MFVPATSVSKSIQIECERGGVWITLRDNYEAVWVYVAAFPSRGLRRWIFLRAGNYPGTET